MSRQKRKIVRGPDAVPFVFTGDMARDTILGHAEFFKRDLVGAARVFRDALEAVIPEKKIHRRKRDGAMVLVRWEEGGAPDWPARLRAGENIFGLVGGDGKLERDARGSDKVIAVSVTLSVPAPAHTNGHHPPALLPAGRLAIHLEGHNGQPAV